MYVLKLVLFPDFDGNKAVAYSHNTDGNDKLKHSSRHDENLSTICIHQNNNSYHYANSESYIT